ncbi:MAG: MBOAT family protein, partial [Leptospiraceae bacterium]|nr:MBOAT family protein [Leptospiraceae bacterium]
MLFNSAIFLLLFFFVFCIYWFLPVRGKHYLIIVASLLFYSWYSIPFLILFLALIVLNYAVSISLLRKKRAWLLAATVALDLAVLGFFKYFYLLAHTVGWALGIPYLEELRANWEQDYDVVIILPIAISFYTFQIIAYVVDTYRGIITEPLAPRRFFVFILFFPQFVAGPILRSQDFIPQIDSPTINPDRMMRGMMLIIQGT